jgi:hypothetical protein
MKTGVILLVAALAGCLQATVYVCPDGSTVESRSDCAITTTTSTVLIQFAADPECSAFKTSDGKSDTALIRRCQVRRKPSVDYCLHLPEETGFSRADCLTELAAVLNDTRPCETLDGNMKVTCEASATKDARACERIPLPELREKCDDTVMRLTPAITRPLNCSGRAGEDLAWCVVYGATAPEDCLRIDETKYPGEAVFCRSRVVKNQSMCGGIADNVMQNMCRKTTVGL